MQGVVQWGVKSKTRDAIRQQEQTEEGKKERSPRSSVEEALRDEGSLPVDVDALPVPPRPGRVERALDLDRGASALAPERRLAAAARGLLCPPRVRHRVPAGAQQRGVAAGLMAAECFDLGPAGGAWGSIDYLSAGAGCP